MANRDHTVRARPSFPDDGNLTASSGHPPATASAEIPELPCDPLDAALAVLALARLRNNRDRYLAAVALGLPTKPVDWPLSEEFREALKTAIRCLEHVVAEHGHVPTVNTQPVR